MYSHLKVVTDCGEECLNPSLFHPVGHGHRLIARAEQVRAKWVYCLPFSFYFMVFSFFFYFFLFMIHSGDILSSFAATDLILQNVCEQVG